jgi:hypothetical protein
MANGGHHDTPPKPKPKPGTKPKPTTTGISKPSK